MSLHSLSRAPLMIRVPSIISILEGCLLFTIFFPYVPGILPTDTQPWFFALFCALFLVKSLTKSQKVSSLGISKNPILRLVAFLILGFIFSILVRMLLNGLPQITRIFSFLQFLTALIYGLSFHKKGIKEELFFKIVITYVVFTIIYFVTNGVVENLLVFRKVDTTQLLLSGRGARTLSGEPTFFVLTLLNIYIIKKLLYPKTTFTKSKHILFNSLLLSCIFSSFSGYGVAILGIIIICEFPSLLIIAFIGVLFFINDILYYLDNTSNRALNILNLVISGKGGELLDFSRGYGLSFGVRFNALIHNWNRFIEYKILGGGFTSTNVGGGLVSFLAEIGLTFFILLTSVLIKIFFGNFGVRFKMVLIFWFSIRFMSDSMGIPGVGLILGMILIHK